ncbi:MAG: hypothetical protein ACOC1P_00030 [Minisyncoccales bacterium]
MKEIKMFKIPRVIKNHKTLEKELEVKINTKNGSVFLQGTPENEYIAEQVIRALDLGFPLLKALNIKKNDAILEVLNLKDYARTKNTGVVKSRIIGTKGKTLRILEEMTNSFFEVSGNSIGIICAPEKLKDVTTALVSLIKGSKHGNVYGFIKRNKGKNEELTREDLKEDFR